MADFPSAEQAARSPLAKALFTIPEVSRVFFGADFISVTKRDGDWKHLKPAILGAVMEHFTRGLPLLEGAAVEAEETYSEADAEVVGQIMTRHVRVASAHRSLLDLLPLFTDGGHHHIPIVGEHRKLVGIVSRSNLLRALASQPNRPLGREKLLALAHGDEHGVSDRSLDVQVMRLRRLVEVDPSAPRHIQTVWGLGYVFIPDPV